MKILNSWIRERPGWLAVALILIASIRIISTYRVLSQTTDEPAHLAAGIEWIQNGTYTYEDQHPPLARVAGALGLYLTGSRWTYNKDMYTEGFLLLGQGKRYSRALFYSRLFMLPFFWIGSAAVYWWGFRVGGRGPALFATLLFTTTPPVLAHAGLATTDMVLTAFVVAALLASLYWAEDPNWRRSVLFGALLGLALISKFSSLAFLPVAWLLMYIIHLVRDRPRIRVALRSAGLLACWAAMSVTVGALIIWAAYRFDVGRVDYLNATLPAPKFFTGIHYVYLHNQDGHKAYLLGQLSQTGFWYYYPVVLAVKTPIATLILMFVAIGFAVKRHDWSRIAMPLALVAAVLAVGLFSRINIGVRHILPIYAGIAVCGGVALYRLFGTRGKLAPLLGALLLTWQVLTGTAEHPDYISYTNAFAGSHPERIIADSDLDWDQGMGGLALRLKALGVQHFTFQLNSSGYMIAGNSLPPYDLMPDGDQPPRGWNAVCITKWKLSGQPKWAERIEPIERIHHSIYLYYFDPK